MAPFARISLAAGTLVACTTSVSQPLAVCPLPASSLAADPISGTRVVWNYLGTVPLPTGWTVREAIGTRLVLGEARSGSTLELELSCCGALSSSGEGVAESAVASGRRFDIRTLRREAATRQTYTTFPFAIVDLRGGSAKRGQLIQVPALFIGRLTCTDLATCAQGRAIVLSIGYDENATRLAVKGVAGPGTRAAPLRDDGIPSDIDLASPVREVAPRAVPNVYTSNSCNLG